MIFPSCNHSILLNNVSLSPRSIRLLRKHGLAERCVYYTLCLWGPEYHHMTSRRSTHLNLDGEGTLGFTFWKNKNPVYFSHFIMLESFSKIVFFPHQSTIPHNDKAKKGTVEKRKERERERVTIILTVSVQTLCYETQFRCQPFLVIVFEMFLRLHWTPTVVNSINWTWFGEVPVLCKASQLTMNISGI